MTKRNNMTDLHTAAELALEALEDAKTFTGAWPTGTKAITALREALVEQPAQQEPVQRYSPDGEGGMEIDSLGAWVKFTSPQPAPVPEAHEQEPVAWLKVVETPGGWGKFVEAKPNEKGSKPVYTSPPAQRKPLTDEEIEREWQFLYDEEGNPPDHHDFARAIEAAHGIKENT